MLMPLVRTRLERDVEKLVALGTLLLPYLVWKSECNIYEHICETNELEGPDIRSFVK